ncbi:S1C family serine protease [Salibacterium lacus]|uniref:S1C family serine protease n=1 Tax=Salibacterium lacus TaxID=1898109 RepID=A0ABW5SYH5_9BACI
MKKRHKDTLEEMHDKAFEDLSYEEFQEALEEEPKQRTIEKRKRRKKHKGIKWTAFVIAVMLIFQTSAMLFDTFRLDVFSFLQTSYRLSQDEQIQDWKESVVTVQGDGKYIRTQGTGFFISEDGLALTNHHVIENQDAIAVSAQGGEIHEGELLAADAKKDLALLDIEGNGFSPLPLQEKNDTPGDHIYVIGNPLSFTKIANEGKVLTPQETGGDKMGLSAPIYQGNSGSPVITGEGKVSGVVYAKRTGAGTEQDTIGLAVSAEEVNAFLEEHDEHLE